MGNYNSSESTIKFLRWIIPLKQLTDPLNNSKMIGTLDCNNANLQCSNPNSNTANFVITGSSNISNIYSSSDATINGCLAFNIIISMLFLILSCIYFYYKLKKLNTNLLWLLLFWPLCALASLFSFWSIFIYGLICLFIKFIYVFDQTKYTDWLKTIGFTPNLI